MNLQQNIIRYDRRHHVVEYEPLRRSFPFSTVAMPESEPRRGETFREGANRGRTPASPYFLIEDTGMVRRRRRPPNRFMRRHG